MLSPYSVLSALDHSFSEPPYVNRVLGMYLDAGQRQGDHH